jgi:glycosyltransferase involved in cell wall biosynthesis
LLTRGLMPRRPSRPVLNTAKLLLAFPPVETANTSPRSLEISVCVPVRNEENSIRALITRLLAQTLPPAEIVITDSSSSDHTIAIIEEFIKHGAPVKLIREKAALPGRGRNVAVANSRCNWIAFIDAGTVPEPDWLERLAQSATADHGVEVVYGTYEPVTDSLFKLCAVMAYVSPPYKVDDALVRHPSVVSALMKRSVWESVGGFPEDLRSAEDLLFMRKIEQKHFRTVRAPGALVHWQVEPTARKTFKRFVRYARNNMRAGLWREWQARLFMRYALLLLTLLVAMFFGWKGLFAPVVLWFLLLGGRAIVALARNRVRYPGNLIENVTRLLILVPLIAILDAATMIGTLQWALKGGR